MTLPVDQIGSARLPRALADFVQRQPYGWGPLHELVNCLLSKI